MDLKVLSDAVSTRSSECWPSGSVAAHVHDGSGQCGGISGRDELSRQAIDDNFGVASDGGRYDGESDRHRFEQRERNPFRQRRRDEEARLSQQFGHVGSFTEELDATRDSQFACQSFEQRPFGSVANQLQLEIGDLLNGDRDRSQQRWEILLGGEACHGDRNRRGDRSSVREVTEIDAVPNASHLARRDAIGLDAQFCGVVGHRDDAIDEMAGPPELRARLPAVTGALPVSRVDDDGHSGQACGETGVQVRVRVVCVNDIEAACTKQLRHLPNETDAARRSQQMNGTPRPLNLFRESSDFANGQKFGDASCGIMMPRNVGQDPLQPAGLQRQADMTDAQWSRGRGSGLENRQCELSCGHFEQVPWGNWRPFKIVSGLD